MRRADPLGCTVAAAALAGFAYWVVHGSLDWFWEFAGLGAPAFALLGLACALAPRRVGAESRAQTASEPSRGTRARRPRSSAEAPGDARAPRRPARRPSAPRSAPSWRSRWRTRSRRRGSANCRCSDAARIWTRTPGAAYADLNDAARLNPLSAEAYLVAGSIALRYNEVAHADREFALALARSPDDAYATLERGAIASAQGRRAAAVEMLRRAVALDPRDELAGAALRLALDGRRINVDELNGAILHKAQQLS